MLSSRITPSTVLAPTAFLGNLKQSRLLSCEQFDQVAWLAEQIPAEDLPGALVADGILTPFQARCVAEGDVRWLVLGPYHVLEEVGRGESGRVYKALHTVMGRVVALKLMSPELSEGEQSRKRFLREVRSVTRLYHPNIVLAHDANEVDGVLFLAMEYVEGTTLAQLVRKEGALPVEHVCELIRQAAMGLQHAHQKELIHRDIKPANLLIPRPCLADAPAPAGPDEPAAGESPVLVKIADFGLARLNSGDTVAGETATGFLGTPDYVAPEQCHNSSLADIRSDLYSLGCTFHFALTGRAPFQGDSAMEKLFAHVTAPVPSVAALRPDIPTDVAAIVARLMAKKPDDRFQTPAELVMALAAVRAGAGSGLAAWAPPATGERSDAPGRIPDQTRVVDPLSPRCAAADVADTKATPLLKQDQPVTTPFAAGAPDALPKTAPANHSTFTWDSSPELAVESLSPTCLHSKQALPVSGAATLEMAQKAAPDTPLRSARAAGSIAPMFRQALARWTALIESLIRRPDLAPCTEQSYQQLHRVLLEECAAHAQKASDEDRGCLRRLEELIQPWMSLAVLTRTDQQILQDLARRARQNGRALGLEEDSWGWLLWLVVLALLAGGLLLFIQFRGGSSAKPGKRVEAPGAMASI